VQAEINADQFMKKMAKNWLKKYLLIWLLFFLALIIMR